MTTDNFRRPPPPDSSPVEPALRLDCRHYRGDRPCAAGIPGVCPPACGTYQPMSHRILVIKLGALGDVLRTTALLPGLKAAWPHGHVTWVTRDSGVRLLANQPLIDRLLPFNAETICHLECEQFDLCLSLDKEPGPAALALRVSARQRRGIGLSRFGTVFPFNPECAEYFRLGLDDHLKFRQNAKTHQQLLYEAVGLRYAGQRYRLYPTAANHRRAEHRWIAAGVQPHETVIGLNTGAGEAFVNKAWSPERFARLAAALARRHGWRVALLGGPAELSRNRRIDALCGHLTRDVAGRAVPAVVNVCDQARRSGPPLTELDFAALVQRCQVVVTGDTLGMHVAIAAEIPCVVLFGPTCPQEIELYGRGTRIVTDLPCAPCYRHSCDRTPNCMDAISVADVLSAVEQWVGVGGPAPQAVAPDGASPGGGRQPSARGLSAAGRL